MNVVVEVSSVLGQRRRWLTRVNLPMGRVHGNSGIVGKMRRRANERCDSLGRRRIGDDERVPGIANFIRRDGELAGCAGAKTYGRDVIGASRASRLLLRCRVDHGWLVARGLESAFAVVNITVSRVIKRSPADSRRCGAWHVTMYAVAKVTVFVLCRSGAEAVQKRRRRPRSPRDAGVTTLDGSPRVEARRVTSTRPSREREA